MKGTWRYGWALMGVMVLLNGCSEAYKGVVKPAPHLGLLSKELGQLTDAKIEVYLKAQVRPSFPSVLAVGRLPGSGAPPTYDHYSNQGRRPLESLQGEETAAWRQMTALRTKDGKALIDQVQLLNPMLISEAPTLKSLRDAAALVHAPLLLVYLQDDTSDEGANSAAMAYWTIIGLFLVPGNTVGRYSLCQGVLVDTQSGFVLATVQGESRVEENVLPGAVSIARRRVDMTARQQAVARLVENVREALLELAQKPSTRPVTTGP